MERDGVLLQQHREHFLFVFFPLVQQSVQEYVQYWNDHPIRYQEHIALPSGAPPNDLYYLPEQYGGRQCGCVLNVPDIQDLRVQHNIPHTVPEYISPEFQTAARDLLQRNNVNVTMDTAMDAFQLLVRNLQ